MPLQPGYGETPLSGDELDTLLLHVVDTLGLPVSKADIFDLESANLQDVAEGLIADVFNGDLILDELLTPALTAIFGSGPAAGVHARSIAEWRRN